MFYPKKEDSPPVLLLISPFAVPAWVVEVPLSPKIISLKRK